MKTFFVSAFAINLRPSLQSETCIFLLWHYLICPGFQLICITFADAFSSPTFIW